MIKAKSNRLFSRRFNYQCSGGARVTSQIGGFTLIELVITLAIVAILTAIAIASYDFAIIKSNRNQGSSCLMELARGQEQYNTERMTYAPGVVIDDVACVNDLTGTYDFAFAPPGPGATTFRLSATPQGRQDAGDTKCKVLTVDQAGDKTVTGSASGNPNECF